MPLPKPNLESIISLQWFKELTKVGEVKRRAPRKPMPKPYRPMPSRVDKEKARRFNAYLKLWKAMQDKEDQCQG